MRKPHWKTGLLEFLNVLSWMSIVSFCRLGRMALAALCYTGCLQLRVNYPDLPKALNSGMLLKSWLKSKQNRKRSFIVDGWMESWKIWVLLRGHLSLLWIKNQGPQHRAKIVGLLVQGHPRNGPENL